MPATGARSRARSRRVIAARWLGEGIAWRRFRPGSGPRFQQVVVLVGATGDLARRKLCPGLFHLARAGFIPRLPHHRRLARRARRRRVPQSSRARRSTNSSARKVNDGGLGRVRRQVSTTCRSTRGPRALHAAVARARRLRSAPRAAGCTISACRRAPRCRPCACSATRSWSSARASSWRSRSAPTWRAPSRSMRKLHEVFAEEQIFRIDHFLGKEPAQNILAFRFANGLFEPIWNRNFIDHVQIDVPETLGLGKRAAFYETDRRLSRHGRHAPVPDPRRSWRWSRRRALEPRRSARRRTRCSAACCRSSRPTWCAASTSATATEEGVDPESDTETFIALKCCDRQLALGRRAVLPAHRQVAWPRASGSSRSRSASRRRACFPPGSGVGAQGPDHLTFDLADASKMSLSFYGKRPGPGMRLDKLSLQFAMHDTGADRRRARGVRAADPRRDARRSHAVHDRRGHRAAVGGVDAAARVAAAGARSTRRAPGARTRSISSIAPHAWRLPFERVWRDPNPVGA